MSSLWIEIQGDQISISDVPIGTHVALVARDTELNDDLMYYAVLLNEVADPTLYAGNKNILDSVQLLLRRPWIQQEDTVYTPNDFVKYYPPMVVAYAVSDDVHEALIKNLRGDQERLKRLGAPADSTREYMTILRSNDVLFREEAKDLRYLSFINSPEGQMAYVERVGYQDSFPLEILFCEERTTGKYTANLTSRELRGRL